MAVTKRQTIVTVSAAAFFMILGFQNCAVELSDQTYGASGLCAPTTSDLADFDTALTSFFQNTGTMGGSGKAYCGQCHLVTSGDPAATQLGILAGTDDASKTTNWCTVSEHSSQLKSGYLQGSHPGGVYTPAEVQTLIDWANTL